MPIDTQIPAEESQTLALVLADAARIAGEGRVSSGYHLLCAGRSRALRARYLGHPWGGALASAYDTAIFHFTHRFNVVTEGPEPQLARQP